MEHSSAKLVGDALKDESTVLFLTKDRDFDVKRVLEELRERNIEVYNSGACLKRIKDILK